MQVPIGHFYTDTDQWGYRQEEQFPIGHLHTDNDQWEAGRRHGRLQLVTPSIPHPPPPYQSVDH